MPRRDLKPGRVDPLFAPPFENRVRRLGRRSRQALCSRGIRAPCTSGLRGATLVGGAPAIHALGAATAALLARQAPFTGGPHAMRRCAAITVALALAAWQASAVAADEKRLNNLASELLSVESVAGPSARSTFSRPADGWIFVSATCSGRGSAKVVLENATGGDPLIDCEVAAGTVAEAVRCVAAGEHRLRVTCSDTARIDKLVVRAIPELVHCGLGFDPAIKAYGRYDMDFLARDVLPNVTTLIVPHHIALAQAAIDDWHRQGKRFVAEVGINAQAKTADEHFQYWTGFLDKAPLLDGVIVNEFIVNAPSARRGTTLSPERQKRRDEERARHRMYEEAFRRMRADERYRDKMLYAYVGGSGKKLNQEVIGPTFVRTLIDCDYRIALERYLFEVSSPEKSRAALDLFVEGVADWEAQQPGVKQRMVIALGLFSMPPGGINKQPNVDYHVWMDQQMHRLANDPALAGIGGVEWWTSILADEETVRFVGRLYRHYAIEGHTEMLTRDPLFLPHLQNADFEKGTADWTLQPAEPGSIEPRSFPRYGRIEGRYMGLGRPADPEHIGDTFLWMKRSAKGPNTFSQTIKDLQPGRLYSLKMFSCDYRDLVEPAQKTVDEANRFIGQVTLDGVDVDARRSFAEMYASSPEPPIPVWITYHWFVFRARGATAKLTVSDWPRDATTAAPFGQEQTFNFLELQPYHE
jgi:hypothetical protein